MVTWVLPEGVTGIVDQSDTPASRYLLADRREFTFCLRQIQLFLTWGVFYNNISLLNITISHLQYFENLNVIDITIGLSQYFTVPVWGLRTVE